MLSIRRQCAVVSLVVALAAAGAVRAAPTTRQQELAARKAFAEGDWKQALDLFAGLYAETLHPVYLRNIGRCHQKLGDPVRAIGAFRDYLARNKQVGPEERAEIEGYIKEMETLRDEQEKTRAAEEKRAAPPPPPEVHPAVPTLQVAAPPPAPPSSPPVYQRWWFWTVIGAAVAGGVAAAFLLRPSSSNCPALECK
jgi:hypothetical protein